MPVMDLNRALAAAQILASETPSFRSIGDSHPKLIAELKRLEPARTASMFAGLLLLPELQSNCLRIEVLVHLALAYCDGRSAPTGAFVRRAFEELGKGFCGRLEDPAEDVFASLVHTPSGNFRIFEGIREGTTFYLQRILNIVQKMPSAEPFNDIRGSVESLLRLSDAVADRSGVRDNSLGQEVPLDCLPKGLVNRCALTRNLVRFNKADLLRLDISQVTLSEFIYRADLRSRTSLQAQTLGHTDLERRPILAFGGSYYLVLPTAVASAITRFVIETVISLGKEEVFVTELAREFGQLFAETRLLGGPSRAPIHFQRLASGRIGAVMTEVDPGRFLHLVFSVDGLSGFDRDGLAGINPEFMTASSAISQHLKLASNAVAGQSTFRDGIMVVVNCGFGRGTCFGIEGASPKNWRFESIPAHDLITLSWLSDFRPLTLWSLLDAQETIRKDGTTLLNLNGLLNLVAWAQELDGHIVPHGQAPNVLRRSDGRKLVVVRQNAIRDVRHTVLIDCDARRILDSEGRWVKVRKLDKSEFEEDNSAPLYGSEEDVLKGKLRAVFLAPLRPWWIEIIPPDDASHDSVFEPGKCSAFGYTGRRQFLMKHIRDSLQALFQFKSDLPRLSA